MYEQHDIIHIKPIMSIGTLGGGNNPLTCRFYVVQKVVVVIFESEWQYRQNIVVLFQHANALRLKYRIEGSTRHTFMAMYL